MAAFVKKLRVGQNDILPITNSDAIKVKNEQTSLTDKLERIISLINALANQLGYQVQVDSQTYNYKTYQIVPYSS